MKKQFVALLLVILIVVCASCAKVEEVPSSVDPEVVIEENLSIEFEKKTSPQPIVVGYADGPVYMTSESFVDAADLIFEGEIVGVEYDLFEHKSHVEGNDPFYLLSACYEISVSKTYYGSAEDTVYVTVIGADYPEEYERLKKEKGYDFEGRCYNCGEKLYDVGCKALFSLCEYSDGSYYILNPVQFALPLDADKRGMVSAEEIIVYLTSEQANA